jgi:hypothetical protein
VISERAPCDTNVVEESGSTFPNSVLPIDSDATPRSFCIHGIVAARCMSGRTFGDNGTPFHSDNVTMFILRSHLPPSPMKFN